MADKMTKLQRSRAMAAVRSYGNKSTELALIRIFRENKISGWRRTNRNIPGKPDFIFPARNTAVFVDGCFWHGCKKHFLLPKSNREFWKKKISKNMKRDIKINRQLRFQGWKVKRIWEHKLKGKKFISLVCDLHR